MAEADAKDWLGSNQDPDVLLSVPNLGIDRIYLGVDNIKADVELHAKVLDLLELHVGAKVSIDKVELEIDNVRVQAMLKVNLDKVVELVDSVVEFLDHHPEVLSNLTEGVGRGLEGALAPKQSGDGQKDEQKQVGQNDGQKSGQNRQGDGQQRQSGQKQERSRNSGRANQTRG